MCLLLAISPDLLAQGTPVPTAQDVGGVLGWLGLVIVLVVLGGIGLVVYRRRVLAQDDDARSGRGLLLDDLRTMRDRGQISPEEFETAKRSMVAHVNRTAPPAPPSPVPSAPRRPSPSSGLQAPPGYDLTGSPLPGGPGAAGAPARAPGMTPPKPAPPRSSPTTPPRTPPRVEE